MRASLTDRQKELHKIFEPYWVYDGTNSHLREDAPQEVKAAYAEACEIAKEQKKAMY